MKSCAFGLFAIAGLATSASADLVIHTPAVQNVLQSGLTGQIDRGSNGSADATSRRYDRWTSAAPISTVLNGVFTCGGQEVADDLGLTALAPGNAGWLDSLGFAVGIGSGAGTTFTGGVVKISFYDGVSGNVIPSVGGFTGFTANLPTLALTGAGSSSRISFGAGALRTLGWYFGDNNSIYASLQIQSVLGTMPLANAGMQLRGGGTPIGTSTDNLVGIGAGPLPTGFFNFGGTPLANSAWFIDTESVPAPGTFALLGLGGLIAGRRRRA